MALRSLLMMIAFAMTSGPCVAACHDAGTPGAFPFADEHAVVSAVATLQRASAAGDRDAIAGMVRFPLATSLGGKRVALDRKGLRAHFDDVFNAKVRASIAESRFVSPTDHACTFWNANGLMLGDGEVWLSTDAGAVKIITVNNG